MCIRIAFLLKRQKMARGYNSRGLKALQKLWWIRFQRNEKMALLGALRAELEADIGTGELIITLPGDIGK